MRATTLFLLAVLGLPSASLALPERPPIPNLGQSGKTVTLPDVVFENFPPTPPAGPFASFTAGIPEAPAAGGPQGNQGSNPHDGTPPYGNAWGYGRGNGNTPSVPEPATALMLGLGLAGLAFAGRRRS